MSTKSRTAQKDNRQGQLPYGATEGEHQENLSLLARLDSTFPLSWREMQLLKWIEHFHYLNGDPLRKKFEELSVGGTGWGLNCHKDTAVRVVRRLEREGLITCTRSSNGRHGQCANEYEINWAGVSQKIIASNEVSPDSDPAFPGSYSTSPDSDPAFPGSQNTNHIRNTPPNSPSENTPPNRSGADRSEISSEPEQQAIRDEAKAICKALGKPQEGAERDDLLLAFKVAVLKRRGKIPESIIAAALRRLRTNQIRGEPIRNRAAMFRSGIVVRCAHAAPPIDFHRLEASIEVPEWVEDVIDSAARKGTKQEVCA